MADQNVKQSGETKENSEKNLETKEDRLAIAKDLYNLGSRNYIVKNYEEAADELSQVCALYEEINGPLCDELGMPSLLYAKCLLALALDENKVLDVPEVDEQDDDDDDSGSEISDTAAENGTRLEAEEGKTAKEENETKEINELKAKKETKGEKLAVKSNPITSIDESVPGPSKEFNTSDGDEEPDDDNATHLQVAWETLESAAKIFSKQGLGGLPNLAEVFTELGNIEFENNIPEGAREDYEKALKIYQGLQISVYRRAMAEVNYKIGLTYLLQQSSPEDVQYFKAAYNLLNDEIEEVKRKTDLSEKDKDNIQDIEETKAEILAKITEIEETRQQCIDEVREALNNFMSPVKKASEKDGASSSELCASKPTDISHLIKRKKPDVANAESSPAKKPAL